MESRGKVIKNQAIDETHYTLEYFNLLQRRYLMADGWSLRRIADIFGVISLKAGEKVLDAGCGWGTIAIEAAKRGACVTGIDFSPASLQVAAETSQIVLGDVPIELIKGDVTQLPFPNHSFDKVLCADLVGHLTDDANALFMQECFRVLKPGGSIIVYTPNSYDLTTSNHLLEFLAKKLLHRNVYDVFDLSIPEAYIYLSQEPRFDGRKVYNYLACAPKKPAVLVKQACACGLQIRRLRISRTKTWLGKLPYPFNTCWGGHFTLIAEKPMKKGNA